MIRDVTKLGAVREQVRKKAIAIAREYIMRESIPFNRDQLVIVVNMMTDAMLAGMELVEGAEEKAE